MLIYLMPYFKTYFYFKKKIRIYLYIFFLVLTFNFIEFSTNNSNAKNFVVSNIVIEDEYNLNFNKLKVIDIGFKNAFFDLSQMVLEEKDLKIILDTPIDDIKKLVENFSIKDEKFINKKYMSIMDVQFNKEKLIKFLNSKNIIISLPKKLEVFLVPVLINLEKNNFYYLNNNIFVKNWENIKNNYFQINYILPNEDVEDYISIKNNLKNIESYDFNEIIKKYNTNNYIIMIILKRNNYIKVFSKINLEDKFYTFNKNFKNININNQLDLNSMIFHIKNKYEDYWKSINKMSPSTSVSLHLSVEAYNTKKSLKLEDALSNLDFVNDYRIEKFDNLEIIYKINYASNPKRFLKEIKEYNINIDTSSVNWKIK